MTKNAKIETEIKWTSIICCTFLFLIIFYHHIDKYISGIFYFILFCLVPITFISAIVYSIRAILLILHKRKKLSFKVFIPIIICSLTFIYFFLSPYRFDSEYLESNIQFSSCYEGTQNQAQIKFRKNKSFELHWTGAFLYNEWWTGKWTMIRDTIILKYDKNIAEQLGEKLIIKDNYLIPVSENFNHTKYPHPMFYMGNCRHEN